MAIKTAFLKPSLPFHELLARLPRGTLAVRPELACLKRFLDYSHSQAIKAFRRGGNTAGRFEVEWLCRLACTPSHSKAIAFCRPRGAVVALLSPRKVGAARFGSVGTFACGEKALQSLAGEYGYGRAALEKYALGDLLAESQTVEFLP
ncbi:MAG: hypothetical protein V1787_06230 [Candidatus Micrarchaeota archaeon]